MDWNEVGITNQMGGHKVDTSQWRFRKTVKWYCKHRMEHLLIRRKACWFILKALWFGGRETYGKTSNKNYMKGNAPLDQLLWPKSIFMEWYTSCRSLGIFTLNIMVAYSNLHTSQLKLVEHIVFPEDMQNLTLCRAHWDSGFSNFNPATETESQGYCSRILTFWWERKCRASRSW